MTWLTICLSVASSASMTAMVIASLRHRRLMRSIRPRNIELVGGGPFDEQTRRVIGIPPPGAVLPVVWVPMRVIPGVGCEQAGDVNLVGVYVCQHRGSRLRKRIVLAWRHASPDDMYAPIVELVRGGDAD